MDTQTLETIVDQLMAPGKGLLAADESNSTANKRLESAGAEPSQEMRRQYRQLLLTAEDIEHGLSGVILYDETLRQATDSGQLFIELLKERNIIPGIKTDLGTRDLPNFPGEQYTQGLDGLLKRNQEYFDLGARFAKWRCVIKIEDGKLPTEQCLQANAYGLALYAGLSQQAGLVPIVEPEVLLKGNHSMERCQAVVEQTLKTVFDTLQSFRVSLGGLLLKTSMVLPGSDSGQEASSTEVAEATVQALKASVPAGVGGVVFLSGGQTPAQATENLSEIARLGPHPWPVSFSYARALQQPALHHWAGQPENIEQAQQLFKTRVQLAAAAQQGEYDSSQES